MPRFVSRLLGLTALLLSYPLSVVAQQEAAQSTPRVDTTEKASGAEVVINQVETSGFPKVAIFATVLRAGQPVLGLTATDFRVREDEVDQEPLKVIPQRSPLNAVITIDTSGSIRKALPQVQAAALDFLGVLEQEDSVTVLSFAREVKVISPKGTRQAADVAIRQTVARGDTALFDALYESIRTVQATPGRKAVVLLSDGVDDNGKGQRLSTHTLEEVLALAKQVNVPVFVIGLGAELDRVTLQKVATESRGRFFEAPGPEQLKEIYDQIGKELSGQYQIHYTSNLPGDGAVHRVNLTHSGVFGFKEFIAPTLIAAAPVSPVASTTTAVVTEVVQEKIISSAAGLHVAARMTETGSAVQFDRAEVFTNPATAFEKAKRVDICYSKEQCSFTVPTGNYTVEVAKKDAVKSLEVAVESGKSVQAWVTLNAGGLRVVGMPVPNAAPVRLNRVYVFTKPADAFSKVQRVSACYDKELCEFILPAGKYTTEATFGNAVATTDVEVTAGGMSDASLVLQAASINALATMQANGTPVKVDKIMVSTVAATAFDKPKAVESCYEKETCSFTVTAGSFVVEAFRGAAKASQQVTVLPGQPVNVALNLEAGMANVAATSKGAAVKADKIMIISAASTAFDKPKTLHSCYEKEICSHAVPVGSYLAEVKVGATLAKKEFSVAAGQIVNLEVQLVE